eukprot:scaffold104_cov143-Skeletonema_marinoi.AAC.5
MCYDHRHHGVQPRTGSYALRVTAQSVNRCFYEKNENGCMAAELVDKPIQIQQNVFRGIRSHDPDIHRLLIH